MRIFLPGLRTQAPSAVLTDWRCDALLKGGEGLPCACSKVINLVGLQSFDKAAKIEKASTVVQDCSDELIWFEVKPGNGLLCDDYALINTSALVLHAASSSNPLVDMDDFRYDQNDAIIETGCLTTLPFTCAVGYAADEDNFVEIDGEWVPQNAPVCTVCRPTP